MDAVLHFWERHYCFSKIKEIRFILPLVTIFQNFKFYALLYE